MFGPAKQQRQAIIQVLAYMRQHGLALGDLTALGGEDLRASNPTRVEKARRVEKTWALMARLGIVYAVLADAEPLPPDNSTRRRRGEGVFSQVIENTEKCSAENEPSPETDHESLKASAAPAEASRDPLPPAGPPSMEGTRDSRPPVRTGGRY
jgi:hypothetical protein